MIVHYINYSFVSFSENIPDIGQGNSNWISFLDGFNSKKSTKIWLKTMHYGKKTKRRRKANRCLKTSHCKQCALQSNVGNKRSFDNVNENRFKSRSCSLSSLQVTMSQVDRRIQAFHPSLATSHTTSDQSDSKSTQ